MYLMNQSEMIVGSIPEILHEWLSRLFPTCAIRHEADRIEVYEVEDGYSIGYRMAYCVLTKYGIELSECYRVLGQCIVYCIENGFVPTYMAVPEDYPHIKRLKRVLDAVKLPLGLIVISPEGDVEVAVKPHLP